MTETVDEAEEFARAIAAGENWLGGLGVVVGGGRGYWICDVSVDG